MAHAGTALTPTPVQIVAGDDVLNADLTVPEGARGLVIFAHGSGSSRHSGRNRAVGLALQHAHFNGGLALATRVWDATPKEQQIASASDWAKFTHNIGTFVLNVQDKIEHIGK